VIDGLVCVVGSFMMDLVVRAPRRPGPGETLIGSGFEMFLGGKGFNQAIAAARAGATTAMVGRLGNDEYGGRFRARLDEEGIDATHVIVDQEAGTGIGAPLVEETGENSIVVIPRANNRVSRLDIDAAAQVITGARVLLLQLELPLDGALAAARYAHDAGTIVVLNPAPAIRDLSGFRGLVDVVVPNHAEACHLTGVAADGDAPAIALELRRRLGADVVLTLGVRGALVIDGSDTTPVSPHHVPVVDTVGAGDAFCGALGACLARGAPLAEAATYANAAGALAVTRLGAEPSMPTRDEVFILLDAR
jgi:ribokinase